MSDGISADTRAAFIALVSARESFQAAEPVISGLAQITFAAACAEGKVVPEQCTTRAQAEKQILESTHLPVTRKIGLLTQDLIALMGQVDRMIDTLADEAKGRFSLDTGVDLRIHDVHCFRMKGKTK